MANQWYASVHAEFRQIMAKYGVFNRETSYDQARLVVAAAVTIGLAGYAFAQNTITGAPAGTAPETPAVGTPLPIPG